MNRLKFGSTDIRFTTKGDALYAIALGWPADGKFLITSLADGSANYPGQIAKVELLGSKSNVSWTRGTQGLEIQVPDSPPCKYAYRSGSFRPELSVHLETCKATFRFYKPESAAAVTRIRSFLTSPLPPSMARVQITYTDPGQADPVCRARNAARCSVQGRLDS